MGDDDQLRNFKGEEKRRYPRVQSAVVDIKFRLEDEYQEPAFIKDLSMGGVCLYLGENLNNDRIIYLRVHLLGGMMPIETTGRVVWSSKSNYLNYFEIGIEFMDLGDSDRERLNEYISKFTDLESESEDNR